MPVFKNEDNGTWYVMARYVNWKGERKQKCKRGFATKKEAQEWERMFQLQNSSDLDMSFEAFTELYIRDVKNRLKENTWLTKEHIIRTKIIALRYWHDTENYAIMKNVLHEEDKSELKRQISKLTCLEINRPCRVGMTRKPPESLHPQGFRGLFHLVARPYSHGLLPHAPSSPLVREKRKSS